MKIIVNISIIVTLNNFILYNYIEDKFNNVNRITIYIIHIRSAIVF